MNCEIKLNNYEERIIKNFYNKLNLYDLDGLKLKKNFTT